LPRLIGSRAVTVFCLRRNGDFDNAILAEVIGPVCDIVLSDRRFVKHTNALQQSVRRSGVDIGARSGSNRLIFGRNLPPQ
jgi:hypothetical protein